MEILGKSMLLSLKNYTMSLKSMKLRLIVYGILMKREIFWVWDEHEREYIGKVAVIQMLNRLESENHVLL
jgi:hypothetical protein